MDSDLESQMAMLRRQHFGTDNVSEIKQKIQSNNANVSVKGNTNRTAREVCVCV